MGLHRSVVWRLQAVLSRDDGVRVGGALSTAIDFEELTFWGYANHGMLQLPFNFESRQPFASPSAVGLHRSVVWRLQAVLSRDDGVRVGGALSTAIDFEELTFWGYANHGMLQLPFNFESHQSFASPSAVGLHRSVVWRLQAVLLRDDGVRVGGALSTAIDFEELPLSGNANHVMLQLPFNFESRQPFASPSAVGLHRSVVWRLQAVLSRDDGVRVGGALSTAIDFEELTFWGYANHGMLQLPFNFESRQPFASPSAVGLHRVVVWRLQAVLLRDDGVRVGGALSTAIDFEELTFRGNANHGMLQLPFNFESRQPFASPVGCGPPSVGCVEATSSTIA